MKKTVCAILAFLMISASFASCGGKKNPAGTVSKLQTGEVVNLNAGIRYNNKNELLFLPEDVGEINNPVVSILTPGLTDDWWDGEMQWRMDAYGIEVKPDNCTWNEREAKWISAYVAGTPYDVFYWINYPTTVLKGLVQPLDDLLPIDDERYFEGTGKWMGKTYGVRAKDQYAPGEIYNCSGVYGLFFNKGLFEDQGLELPSDLWDKGEWDFQHFYDAALALTLDYDRDGLIDQIGCTTWMYTMFTVANGAKTVGVTDDGIKLTWNDPKYVEGLEWLLKCAPYAKTMTDNWYAGKAGMYAERIVNSQFWADKVSFDWDWVPYPKGPSAYGYEGYAGPGTATLTCYIGTGSKNVEGAKVFICADLARSKFCEASLDKTYDHVTEEQINRCREMAEIGERIQDYSGSVGSIGDQMWKVWGAIKENGAKSTIDKFTPVLQKDIDLLMSTEVETDLMPSKYIANADFEDGVNPFKDVNGGMISITDNASEVISGSKSLKIQLSPNVEYGPYAITTSDNYHFAYGGKYKLTFKVKAVNGVAPPQGPLYVTMRPSGSLETGDTTVSLGGWNSIDLSDGQVHEFEMMINVLDFYEDLQLFLIGSTGPDLPNLAIILDDFAVEEIF